MGIAIGIGVVVAAIVALFASGYVKSPPDTAYIISGFRKPRILIGKAGIRIPFLERIDKLYISYSYQLSICRCQYSAQNFIKFCILV
mgnify:CR=1 FL=1